MVEHEEKNIKSRILDTSFQLFSQNGFRSVTMDDIARELGMSKKTIYQHVSDKKTLIFDIVTRFVSNEIEVLRNEHNDITKNALDKMIFFYKRVNHILQQAQPAFFNDLKKFYPKCWNYVEEQYFMFIKKYVKENTEEGLNEEIYREGLDPDFVSDLFVGHIQMNQREMNIPDSSKEHMRLVNQWHLYHLYAIVGERGQKLLKKYTKENFLLS